ncbi:signal peptidase I [Microbacterium sp. zg.Y909]|uniref:signal peptidase I n=1 Tax=Microbacterium sp. zg.Y909 TaxID=2969413 RepID=UPI00214B3F0A|nr:signal peptidase I [Microbacterium sp. zg.Y909]MCR2827893.1 signal peptidase I [Microbacterium sp. zg.Y909]
MTVTAPSPRPVQPSPRRAHRAAQRRDRSLPHYLGVALGAALMILTMSVAIAVVALPALVGGTAMTVLTQSMEPGLPPGTLVVIKPTPVDDIRVGDVITYQIRSGDPAVVSHRVVSKTYAGGEVTFMTKGDNNSAADPDPVQPAQIRGTLWYSLPLLGWVNSALYGTDRTIVLAVVAGGLFLYAAGLVVSAVRDKRRRRAAADDAAEI